MNFRHSTRLLALICACAAPVVAQSLATLEVTNPSPSDRPETELYLSFHDLGLNEDAASIEHLTVLHEGKALPSQLVDTDADGENDNILYFVDLPAKATLVLEIVLDADKAKTELPKRTQAEISIKQGGKWVDHQRGRGLKEYRGGTFTNVDAVTLPDYYTDHSYWIRYEGPGIESDKVAYRVYLDWRNGFDIFGKRVPEPILQKVGQDGYDAYHSMQAWGMDLLKVGTSLGAGGYGFWDGDKVQIVQKTSGRSASIINNGPLYSSFKIHYKDWQINDQTLDLDAHLSMAAGSRLVETRLSLSEGLPNLAIGVVKHDNTALIEGDRAIPDEAFTYFASWGQQSLSGDHLGMAVFFQRRDFTAMVEDKSSYAAQMRTDDNALRYYFAAAWEGEHGSGIDSKEAFIAWLEGEAKRLTQTPRAHLTIH